MRGRLGYRLHEHLQENFPDMLLQLERENRVANFLAEQVESAGPLLDELMRQGVAGYIAEEQCMAAVVAALGFSKGNYLRSVLDEEFPEEYLGLLDSGVFFFELPAMMRHIFSKTA